MASRDDDNRTPSPRATRIALLVMIPVAVVFGVQAVSWAVPKMWSHGDTLTADDLNRNFQALEDALAASQSNPWIACGTLQGLRTGATVCQLDAYPIDHYEYGFKYNSAEVRVADCQLWNVGVRVANRVPYFVNADDPTNGAMQLGGTIFYTETLAVDDDTPAQCPTGKWRMRYWQTIDGRVALLGTNGCLDQPLFCRRR